MSTTLTSWPSLKPAVLQALPPGAPLTIDDGFEEAQDWTNVRLPKRRRFDTLYFLREDFDEQWQSRRDPASYHAVHHVSVHFTQGDDTFRAWVPVMAVIEMRAAMLAALEAAGPSVLGGAVETLQLEGGDPTTLHVVHGEPDRHGRDTVTTFSYVPNCEYWDNWEREDKNSRWLISWVVDSQIWYWNAERGHWAYDVSEYTGWDHHEETW